MLLKCLIDHTHDSQAFKAGDVYEVEDGLGARLLRDYGPGDTSENAKRGNSPKFEATTEPATEPADPAASAAPEAEAEAKEEDKDESESRRRR